MRWRMLVLCLFLLSVKLYAVYFTSVRNRVLCHWFTDKWQRQTLKWLLARGWSSPCTGEVNFRRCSVPNKMVILYLRNYIAVAECLLTLRCKLESVITGLFMYWRIIRSCLCAIYVGCFSMRIVVVGSGNLNNEISFGVFIVLLYVCVSCELWCYTVDSITEQYEPCHH